jgi:hypothetical protein
MRLWNSMSDWGCRRSYNNLQANFLLNICSLFVTTQVHLLTGDELRTQKIHQPILPRFAGGFFVTFVFRSELIAE